MTFKSVELWQHFPYCYYLMDLNLYSALYLDYISEVFHILPLLPALSEFKIRVDRVTL